MGHGFLLANNFLSLLRPSVFDFGSGTERRARQRNDRHQRIMLPLYGGGGIVILYDYYAPAPRVGGIKR